MRKIYLKLLLFALINPVLLTAQGSFAWQLDGGCNTASDCDADQICYGLVYTSGFTGTLQSYTNFLFIDCVNDGDPTIVNQSCVIVDNSENNDGGSCAAFGDAEVRLSGQQGTFMVEAGMEYIIHEYCVNLSDGESTTLAFDRTSLNGFLTDGTPYAEAPIPSTLTVDKDVDCFVLLPVELVDFTVLRSGTDAVLNWATATEINNDYFDIQHSLDGQSWSTIGTVDGKGNSTTLVEYSYTHTRPVNGLNYYRLLQVDYDGASETSAVRSVRFDRVESKEFGVYPNPTNTQLYIKTDYKMNGLNLVIRNMQNKVVLRVSDINSNVLDVSALIPGVYSIQVVNSTTDRMLDHRRFIVAD